MERQRIELFASCLVGFESALGNELKRLRMHAVRPLKGGVAFSGTAADAERVCLWSRVASRVTAVVGRVNAGDADLLYEGVRRIPWHEVIAAGASLAVRAHGTNAELRNSQFTALKVKDGICDALRETRGERPNIESHDPDALIEVRVRDNRATITFDVSGGSLHRRTYFDKRDGADAVIAVAHAAGLLEAVGAHERLAEGWGLIDPACDTGILVCEAAGIASDLAPGLLRQKWGFTGWALHDEEVWADILAEADDRFDAGLGRMLSEAGAQRAADAPDVDKVRIVGTSASSPAISLAREHLRASGLRAVASVEAARSDDAVEITKRLARITKKRHQAAMIVAHASAVNRDGGDARAVSETGQFMSAALNALPGSVFASIDASGMRDRFGFDEQMFSFVGAGDMEMRLQVFDRPPASVAQLSVPSSAGGRDRAVVVNDAKAEQFSARLRKVWKERKKWAQREQVSCYRLYDADLPDYNAAIDVYEGVGESAGKTFVHVAEYKAPSSVDEDTARRRFEDILALVPEVLGVRPDHVFSKVRARSRGGSQYRDAGRRSYVAYTEEAGLCFEIDLAGYLDTGLFLDHRDTRMMVGRMAQGCRFLNLFAYTGTATVHAAAGGAASTTTVDLSQTYLDWAQRNMDLNGFGEPESRDKGRRERGRDEALRRHEFVRSDVASWIVNARRLGELYDLIFVDPPTFSNSKAMGRRTWDVQRDHVELLIGVSRLLSRDGVAVFSCNLRTFKPDYEQLERYGVVLEDITRDTIPHDFERNPRIHQCYMVRRAAR